MSDLDRDQDDLDRVLARARATPPDGLVERIVAAASDPSVVRRFYWTEVESTARRALALASLGLAAAALFFFFVTFGVAPESSRGSDPAADQVAQLTQQPAEPQPESGLWPLDAEEK